MSGELARLLIHLLSLTRLLLANNQKDSTRVVAGLKAALHNPRVSSEAKERVAQQLEGTETTATIGEHEKHVLAGYKSVLHSTFLSSRR
jgi:Conidiation protein 6